MDSPLFVLNQTSLDLSEEIADVARRHGRRADVTQLGPGAMPGTGTELEVIVVPGQAPGRNNATDQLVELCARGVAWLHVAGAGAEGLPDGLFDLDCIVTSSKGATAVPMAEFVLAQMLAFEKRLPLTWVHEPPSIGWEHLDTDPAASDSTTWGPPRRWGNAPLGTLEGKTLGIVGFGAVGRAVASRAVTFGMRVRALRRRRDGEVAPGVEMDSDLYSLVAVSDHLLLSAPLTAATHHLYDGDAMRATKPGCHLVNVGRGGLVDQKALLEALDSARLAFASLDVADPEPLPSGHPLYTHPRLHLSPHVAGCAPASRGAVVRAFLDNLDRYCAGTTLAGVIDPIERY